MNLVSPVFGKEMVTLARRKRHYFTRALFLGILLAAIGFTWQQNVVARASYGPYSGFVDLSEIGHALFMTFTTIQLLAVIVLTPALTAPVIAAEKEQDTLSLLLMSNLEHRHILLDKLLSRLALLGLLLLSALPLFLALLAFGGIEPAQIAQAYLDIFSTTLFCAGIGLLCSTFMQKMHTALIAAYAVLGAYGIVNLAAGIIFSSQNFFYFLIPPYRYMGPTPTWTCIVIFLLLSLLVFSLSVRTCIRQLPAMAGRKKTNPIRNLSLRLNAFFHRINFTGVVFLRNETVLDQNAMLWKDASHNVFKSHTFMIRSTYALLIASIVLCIVVQQPEAIMAILLGGGGLMLAILGAVESSAAFTAEREKHLLDVLLSTPIAARDMILAKFAGTLKSAIPILACMTLWMFIACYSNIRMTFLDIVKMLVFVAVHYPFLVVLGLYSSVMRRKTSTAILQTFLVWLGLAGICILLQFYPLPFLLPLSSAPCRSCGGHHGSNFAVSFSHLSPFTSFPSFFDLGRHYYGDDHNFVFLWALPVIGVWGFLLWFLIKRFDRLIGRQ